MHGACSLHTWPSQQNGAHNAQSTVQISTGIFDMATQKVFILSRSLRSIFLNCSKTLSSTSDAKHKLDKRWDITVGGTDDNKDFTIKLNDINLKTPLNNLLRVRDETLALAIANEWKGKAGKKKLDVPSMVLTTLAYEAIDNPFNETKDAVVSSIVEYLKFDTVRFRDTSHEELLEKQSRHWDPLIGWFEHKFDCHLPIEYGDIMNTSSISKHTHETIARYLHSLERWPLIGARFITQNMKSYVLASCLTERFLTVDQAVDLARLETKFQTERWTKVEWEHDLEEQCTKARVAAGTLFYHLCL